MKTINTGSTTAVALKGTKEEQNNLNNKISDELKRIFNIDGTKNTIDGILNIENPDNANEVNPMELYLASIFGKKEKMNQLNKKPILTVESVLKELDEKPINNTIKSYAGIAA